MGHSLSLLTAALLVGQTNVIEHGRNCSCHKTMQGRVQPSVATESRGGSWTWRGTTSATEETYRSASGEGSWLDNRPILSRISNRLFGRGADMPMRMETVQPSIGQPIAGQPLRTDGYRRLPTTTTEPPLGTTMAQPTVTQPRRVEPGSLRPAPTYVPRPAIIPKTAEPTSLRSAPVTPPTAPLTIEVDPIGFRSSGQVKGAAPAVSAPVEATDAVVITPSATTPSVTTPSATTPSLTTPSLTTPSVAMVTASSAPSRPNPIHERFINKVGQPGDYSWITGQLEIRGSKYILHYATPDTIDRFGGSIVLAAPDMSSFKSGDLVSTHGTVVPQGANSAIYRVQTIDLIER